MKKVIVILAVLAGKGEAYAHTRDSLKVHELNEVVVEANYSTANANGIKVIPTARQKISAQNGIDLLRRMAIPQVKVALADNKVTTYAGDPVVIFINYLPASSDELEGLKTTDVRRVEYYYSPSDSRFLGERNVVNIIVQAYEYGGYTKLSAYEKCLIGLSSLASVYSKFSYKRMTYDLYIGSDNRRNRHNGTSVSEDFRLIGNNGEGTVEFQRNQISEASKFTYNSVPISFRAAYYNEKFQARNTVGFVYQEVPEAEVEGKLAYTPDLAKDYKYSTRSYSRINSFSYSGSFNLNLPGRSALSLSPKFNYGNTRRNYSYKTTRINRPIINKAGERAYEASIIAMGRKIYKDVNYVFLRAFGGFSHYDIRYSGSGPSTDKIIERYMGANLQYGYYTDKISADVLFGVRGERNNANSEITKCFYPFANVNFGWSPNQKDNLNFSFSYSKEPLDANLKSANIIRQNELMYHTGNPLLKNAPNIMGNLSYNWMPVPWMRISPFIQHYSVFDRVIPVYTPYLEGTAILRKYVNDGNHHRTQVGLWLTANLLDRSLQIQAGPSQMIYGSTGYYDIRYRPFVFSAAASYYLGNFYFSGYYEMRNRCLWTNSGTVFKDRGQLQISGGWSKSDLNIRIGISNPFRKSWRESCGAFNTRHYSQQTVKYGISAHQTVTFSLTYTIGYGKKVGRDNEIGAQSPGKSAILE